MKKIVLAGGSGFIGRYLLSKFSAQGYEILIVSRSKGDVVWEDKKALVNALEGAEVVINLAGKSVDCRYSEKNKRAILQSRLLSTKALGQALLQCQKPPALWINSSTATIYRHAEDRPMTEANGEIGSGFSVDVAQQWEKAFFDFEITHTRQVALRIAIVLGRSGGVMRPLERLTRFGLGGKQGTGRQMFSWIHIEDLYQIILFLMKHKEMEGVFNCSTPNPVTNEVLMASMRKMLRVPIGLPAPEWLLKIGAVLIRTETELILKSRWVLPRRLLEAGYKFQYPLLPVALNVLNTSLKATVPSQFAVENKPLYKKIKGNKTVLATTDSKHLRIVMFQEPKIKSVS